MDIKESLTKRVGPLPVWAWGAVVIGGIGVFLILRKRGGAASATQEDGLGFGTTTGPGGGGGGGDSPVQVPPHDVTPGPTQPGPTQTGPTATAPTETARNPIAEIGPRTPQEGGYSNATVAAATNALSSSINFMAQQVTKAAPNTTVAGTFGPPSVNRQVVSALTAKGYTAGYYGGQVYAARNNTDYFAGLPTKARNDLARLLVAQSKRAA